MKSKTTLSLLFLLFIIIFFLSSCVDVKKPEPQPEYLGIEAVKTGFFRNGKILYSTSNPDVSMFDANKMIGIRMFKQSGNTSSEDYAYLDFNTISDGLLSFDLVKFTPEGSRTASTVALGKGQDLDINSDGIWDIKWTGEKYLESVSNRGITNAFYIELNSGSEFGVTFRTISKIENDCTSVLTISGSDRFVVRSNCLNVVKQFDKTFKTLEILSSSLTYGMKTGDYMLLNSAIIADEFPVKKVENIAIVGERTRFTLRDLTNEETSAFLAGTKFRTVSGVNPDNPYLSGPRGSSEKEVIWKGKLNHSSINGESVINLNSEEPIIVTLEYVELDFEMNLDNTLRRFYYHPIFGMSGAFDVSVDSREMNVFRVPFISQSIFLEGTDIPLYGDITFAFSAESKGEGWLKSNIRYSLDEAYYSIKIDSQDWKDEEEWIPQGDFRRRITVESASGENLGNVVSITPYLHIDCSLSFMDVFKSQHNDLKIGTKFDSFKEDSQDHLDIKSSFEIASQYAVNYLDKQQCSFPYKAIYSVELSPYIVY